MLYYVFGIPARPGKTAIGGQFLRAQIPEFNCCFMGHLVEGESAAEACVPGSFGLRCKYTGDLIGQSDYAEKMRHNALRDLNIGHCPISRFGVHFFRLFSILERFNRMMCRLFA